jgi:hypothetical protein
VTSRFDVERALRKSELPAGWRHVERVLCEYVDADAGKILPLWQPSLTQLARDTGLHRRTVMRYLAGLEKLGWVVRRRPSVSDARTKHARTQYAVQVGRDYPQASDSKPSVPEMAGDSAPPELGTTNPISRGTAPRKSSRSSRSCGDTEINAVIDAVRARAGVTVTEEWAERVVGQIIGARDKVRDPVAVIHAVISKAPRDTYAPTPQPPRYTATKGFT